MGSGRAVEVTGISCPCEGLLSMAAATGYACVLGDAWTVYQGTEGMAGYGVMEVDGEGAEGGRAGMTARLRPRLDCEGTEAPLAAAARASAFCAADRASGSARFPELTPPL